MIDEERKHRALAFVENVLECHLLPWQWNIYVDVLATVDPKDPDRRQYEEAYVEIPKKNGKSFLAALLALYGLAADNTEDDRHVYLAASTRDQTKHVFNVCAELVRKKLRLKKLFRDIPSTKTIIGRRHLNHYLKGVSADADTEDGMNPTLVVYDELHRQKTRHLLDVLTFGQEARRNPLFFAITTSGIVDESPICWEYHERARQVLEGTLKQPRFYPVLYDLKDKADWKDEGKPGKWDERKGRYAVEPTGWYKANPSLEGNPGGFLRLDAIRASFENAMRSPAAENSFRRFRLCQWVAQESRWIPLHEWDKCGAPFDLNELEGQPCYLGLDLSTTLDITALVLAFSHEDKIKLLAEFWLPEENLARREPADLWRWKNRGLIHTTEGNVIDYRAIRQRIYELDKVYDIREIGHDPWNATQSAVELAGDGFTMVPIRQGFGSLSAPSKAFQQAVMSRQLMHGGNPVLRWMMDCTSVKQDPAGNIKPVKPDRHKTSKRIDGIVAAIMAIDRLSRHGAQEHSAESVVFG